jgi:hypothetical protein
MNLSAGLMTILGLAASFAPQEILSAAGADSEGLPVLLVQITGGLYLGFAMLNWMARGVLIGGIYSRPVAIGNFMHFAVVAITLLKFLMTSYLPAILVATIVYGIFAIWFGLVVFRHPGASKSG